jgi:cob(I)alamin adenosyltransferase
VPKDDPRVQAYGEVDELNAWIGFVVAIHLPTFESNVLETIQRDLFTIGAELATPNAAKLRTSLNVATVSALEDVIDSYDPKLKPLKNFILPGGSPKGAALHVARTVCRRAERAVVALAHTEQINPLIINYLNRLSDLLFVLARAVNMQTGHDDVAW